MIRGRAFALGALVFTCGLTLGTAATTYWSPAASGQQREAMGPITHKVKRNAPMASREDLYSALEQEVTAFDKQSRVISLVAQLMGPSVVHIEAEKVDRTVKRFGFVEEAGSGVIVEMPNHPGERYVLTNSHVIRGADLAHIRIQTMDGRLLRAQQVWEDPSTDVAVVRVPSHNVPAARLGDSDLLGIGEFVLALGSPFGLNHSLTFGIISAKGRRDLELGDDQVKYQDFLQTDAAINPGNSGGPLVNLRGELIGINTAIASNSGGNEGIGFSIPINMVMHVASELIEHGTVMRAFLGVTLDPKFTPAAAAKLGLPNGYGARISAIRENTPAFDGRLLIGDVILEFDEMQVEDDAHLINLVSLTKIGRQVPVVVWRDSKEVRLNVKLGDRQKLDIAQ